MFFYCNIDAVNPQGEENAHQFLLGYASFAFELFECLERAIRLDHRFAYAYSLLGHELIDMNDFGRAAQAFRKAVQFSPNDYRAWYGLGLVNFKEEQLQMARMNLLRAVNINPNNNVLLCQLAVIEQALHNTDAAMQYLESALKHSPNNVPCRFHKLGNRN